MDTEEFAEELLGIKEESPEVEHTVYELFKWSLLLKGVISAAEVVIGIALLFIPTAWIVSGIELATSYLLPYAHIGAVQHIVDEILHYGSASIVFAALFLLSRGLIKSFLIWALLKNIVWAYPASLVVMGLFVVYQIYEFITIGSVLIIGITLFDLIVIYFIWREWRIVKRHHAA